MTTVRYGRADIVKMPSNLYINDVSSRGIRKRKIVSDRLRPRTFRRDIIVLSRSSSGRLIFVHNNNNNNNSSYGTCRGMFGHIRRVLFALSSFVSRHSRPPRTTCPRNSKPRDGRPPKRRVGTVNRCHFNVMFLLPSSYNCYGRTIPFVYFATDASVVFSIPFQSPKVSRRR